MSRDRLVPHVSAGPRLAAAMIAVAIAYRFSLQTLASGWRFDTPLADLVLVPPLAAALLVAASRRYRYVAFLRLGRFDLAIAGLLAVGTAVLLAAGPTLWSKYFWAMRLDLLSLPLFAAAAIVLLFGARALVPLAFPILFLLLAWPLPYLAVFERGLASFTQATAFAVRQLAVHAHLATAVPGSDDARYVVAHHGSPIVVSVAGACSGVNSVVGFGVVGIAALWLVHGRIVRRLAWLAAGVVLVWALNVVRILGVLLAARGLGEHAAFDLLHPVAGLVALNVAFLVLLRALPLFGLHRRAEELEFVDTPLARAAAPAQQATPRRVAGRLAVLAAATVMLALVDGQLASAARGYDNSGRPAVAAFLDRPDAGRGWSVGRLEEIRWAVPYYGRHSSWVRYRLHPTRPVAGPRAFTVWLDAILSPDLGALDAYTVAHCYAFDGFQLDVARRVDLGTGVIGQLFVYRTSGEIWHALAWQWPVLHDKRVAHERMLLLASTPARPRPHERARSGWLTDKLLGLLNTTARNEDPNPTLSHALTTLGTQLVAVRVEKRPKT